MAVSCGLMLLSQVVATPWLSDIAYWILLALNMVPFLYGLGVVRLYREPITVVLRAPQSGIIGRVKSVATANHRYVRYFASRDERDLEEAILALTSAAEHSAKRWALLVGVMEKLGLFPALLSVTFVASKFGESLPAIGAALAYTVPLLYLASYWSQQVAPRLEPIIKLLELALERKRREGAQDEMRDSDAAT